MTSFLNWSRYLEWMPSTAALEAEVGGARLGGARHTRAGSSGLEADVKECAYGWLRVAFDARR